MRKAVLVGVVAVVVIGGCGQTMTDSGTTTATGDASSSGGAINATAGASGESYAAGGGGSSGDGQVLPGAGGQGSQSGGAGGADAGIPCGDTTCPGRSGLRGQNRSGTRDGLSVPVRPLLAGAAGLHMCRSPVR